VGTSIWLGLYNPLDPEPKLKRGIAISLARFLCLEVAHQV